MELNSVILVSLEVALRASLREYPGQTLRFVEGLHQSNNGGELLASLGRKGRFGFEVWVLENAEARFPPALNTGKVQEVRILQVTGHGEVPNVGLRALGGMGSPVGPERGIQIFLNASAAGGCLGGSNSAYKALQLGPGIFLCTYFSHVSLISNSEPTPEEDLAEEMRSMPYAHTQDDGYMQDVNLIAQDWSNVVKKKEV
ncbi:hypothetical protein B0H13DRAFT_1857195 [Mycena leptocephala]|nr:hypothetical protein B0H13DRAFT_1857195 [Mycena leptocephala]